MVTYIVLPGGWAGGWQARQVARMLEGAGRMVVSPGFADLERPGGRRAKADILNARTEAVLALIRKDDLHDIILVGFDLSGEVASEVARLAPDQITRLVYIDAILPTTCRSAKNGSSSHAATAQTSHAPESGGCRQIGEASEAWQNAGASPHAAPPTVLAAALRPIYIWCTGHSTFARLTALAAYRAREAGWGYCELPQDLANRSAVPEEVAGQLLALA